MRTDVAISQPQVKRAFSFKRKQPRPAASLSSASPNELRVGSSPVPRRAADTNGVDSPAHTPSIKRSFSWGRKKRDA